MLPTGTRTGCLRYYESGFFWYLISFWRNERERNLIQKSNLCILVVSSKIQISINTRSVLVNYTETSINLGTVYFIFYFGTAKIRRDLNRG